MTIDQIPNSLPSYTKAVSVLLALASPLFKRSMSQRAEPDLQSEAFEHWYVLRRIAQCWLSNRSTSLCTAEREGLAKALHFVHELSHRDSDAPLQAVQQCSCVTAQRLMDLALLQVADATGVEIPISVVAA